jgi:hypothetical protein
MSQSQIIIVKVKRNLLRFFSNFINYQDKDNRYRFSCSSSPLPLQSQPSSVQTMHIHATLLPDDMYHGYLLTVHSSGSHAFESTHSNHCLLVSYRFRTAQVQSYAKSPVKVRSRFSHDPHSSTSSSSCSSRLVLFTLVKHLLFNFIHFAPFSFIYTSMIIAVFFFLHKLLLKRQISRFFRSGLKPSDFSDLHYQIT